MTAKTSRKKITRRDFLKISALTGAAAVGGYMLGVYTPWRNYDQQVEEGWSALSQNSNVSTQMREIVRYATLAPNGHNTQPWKFAIIENGIEIHPDFTRQLPVVDPNHREMWISLGCALENLLLAASALGYSANVTYPTTSDFIGVQLVEDAPNRNPLVDVIPIRQNTRSEYDGQTVNTNDLNKLQMCPASLGW